MSDKVNAEIERLKALSVENIMLEVIPGLDGMGHEVYAKSVADVHAAFGKMVDREEELEQKLAEAQALLREWGDMFHGGGISGGPLTTLRQKNAAFLSATAQPAEDQNDE